jgi:hypothetical protein
MQFPISHVTQKTFSESFPAIASGQMQNGATQQSTENSIVLVKLAEILWAMVACNYERPSLANLEQVEKYLSHRLSGFAYGDVVNEQAVCVGDFVHDLRKREPTPRAASCAVGLLTELDRNPLIGCPAARQRQQQIVRSGPQRRP